MIRRINHAAFRCLDSSETIDFYTKALGLKFIQAFQNDFVPSMGLDCPHFHFLLELPDKSAIAFFEAPMLPDRVTDPGTPPWVQHVAFDCANHEELEESYRRIESYGVENTGIIDHKVGHSIYFHDPSGHRLELVHWLDQSEEGAANLLAETGPRLERWNLRKATEFKKDKTFA